MPKLFSPPILRALQVTRLASRSAQCNPAPSYLCDTSGGDIWQDERFGFAALRRKKRTERLVLVGLVGTAGFVIKAGMRLVRFGALGA